MSYSVIEKPNNPYKEWVCEVEFDEGQRGFERMAILDEDVSSSRCYTRLPQTLEWMISRVKYDGRGGLFWATNWQLRNVHTGEVIPGAVFG